MNSPIGRFLPVFTSSRTIWFGFVVPTSDREAVYGFMSACPLHTPVSSNVYIVCLFRVYGFLIFLILVQVDSLLILWYPFEDGIWAGRFCEDENTARTLLDDLEGWRVEIYSKILNSFNFSIVSQSVQCGKLQTLSNLAGFLSLKKCETNSLYFLWNH